MTSLLRAYRDARLTLDEMTLTVARFDVADTLTALGASYRVPSHWQYSPGLSARNGVAPCEPFWCHFCEEPTEAELASFANSGLMNPEGVESW